MDAILPDVPSPIVDAAIQSAIRAAKDPADLQERLAVVLSDADPRRFNQTLERSLFAADLLGYAHASRQTE